MDVGLLIGIGAFAAALLFGFSRPRGAICLLGALMFANGLFVDVGISLTAAKVVLLALGIWFLLSRAKISIVPDKGTVFMFLGYGLLVTVCFGIYTAFGEMVAGEARVRWRWAIQAGSFGLSVLPYFLVIALCRDRNTLGRLLDAIVVGAVLLAFLGVLQWLLKDYFGVQLLTIAREGLAGRQFEESFFLVGDYQINRINSLAREPKDLAAAIALVLPLAFFRLDGVLRTFSVSIMLIALVFTYSTTGFVLILMACIFFAHIYMGREIGLPKRLSTLAAFVLAIGFLAFFSYDNDLILEVVDSRILQRVGGLEEYDEVALNFLINEPLWSLTGVGAGMVPRFASEYLLSHPLMADYMDNLTWEPKSGLLRWVSSFGIVGTLLALTSATYVIVALRRLNDAEGNAFGRMLVSYVAFVSVVQALRAVDEYFWLVLGIAAAHIVQERKGRAHVAKEGFAR